MIENKQVNPAASDKRDCVNRASTLELTNIARAYYAGDQGDENDAHKSGRRIVKLCSICGGPAHYANSLTWQCSTTGCPAYHATTPATLGVAPPTLRALLSDLPHLRAYPANLPYHTPLSA